MKKRNSEGTCLNFSRFWSNINNEFWISCHFLSQWCDWKDFKSVTKFVARCLEKFEKGDFATRGHPYSTYAVKSPFSHPWERSVLFRQGKQSPITRTLYSHDCCIVYERINATTIRIIRICFQNKLSVGRERILLG